MRSTPSLLPLVAACALALSAFSAQVAQASEIPGYVQTPQGAMISAGSAPIDKALSTIIPEPYRIELDSRVPRDWVVSWQAGANWMQVLNNALNPMGLVVDPQWGSSVIRVRYVGTGAYVDATSNATIRTAATSGAHMPTLTGASGHEWDWRAPYPPKTPIRLDSAVMRLLPKDLQNASLAMQGVDTSALVRWRPGMSRYDALVSVLDSVGAVASVSKDMVKISPRVAAQPPQPAQEAGPVQVAMPMRSIAQPAPAPSGLSIVAGQPVGRQMKDQAAAQGWHVVWELNHDWIAPSNTVLAGSFEDAASKAVEAMAAEGAPVRATVYTANRTIVISQNGANK